MNPLYMFTGLGSSIKVPFNLSTFVTALPIGADGQSGTILFGLGGPAAGVQVKEPYSQVIETVGGWYTKTAASHANN